MLCFAIEQLDPPAASMASTEGSMEIVKLEWQHEGEVIMTDECYSAETVQAMRDETVQRNAFCIYPHLPKFVDL